jgi:tripeptide aminopeptidase
MEKGNSMIDKDRLASTFTSLVTIDSPSREEEAVASYLMEILAPLGGSARVDDAGEKVGGNTGNLIISFVGNRDSDPIFFNSHMDTVTPGRGIRPIFKNGIFTSDGTTILGADDKSAVAVLVEVMRVLVENDLPRAPIELVFTVCEEIGLLGAKYLDTNSLNARFGYALDATNTAGIVTRAPGSNRLTFTVIGKDAHAGAAPERGINAIHIASQAIAGLRLGRLDAESTCNIGVIKGGQAKNIVPDRVAVEGEVRSHNPATLVIETERMVAAFESAVSTYSQRDTQADLPRLETLVESEFAATHIPLDHPVVKLAEKAGKNLGREVIPTVTGGGADANIFFERGIMVGVLGTGMRDMHTVRESIALDDMMSAAELVLEIIRLHSVK